MTAALASYAVWVVSLSPNGAKAEEALRIRAHRLAVVPVILSASGSKPTLSSIYDAASEAARFRPELAVMSDEEAFVSAAGEERALDCGIDTECVAQRLGALGASLGLSIVVNLDLDPALIGIKLVDCKEGRVVAESLGELAHGSDPFGAVRDRVSALLDRAGFEAVARVLVRVSPEGAVVRLEPGGIHDPLIPGTFWVPQGKHRVIASREGYETVALDVAIARAEDVVLKLDLEETPGLLDSFWFWAAIGGAVAGGAAVVLFATRRTETLFCAPFEGVDCDAAR